MDKVITTALLTMAAVVAAVLVINTMLPALGRSGSSLLSSSGAAADRIKTNVEIIAVSATSRSSVVEVWVKNVGVADLLAIDHSDVFIESPSELIRAIHGPGVPPNWTYAIEDVGGTILEPTRTAKLTITLASLPPGKYVLRFITNNGVQAEKAFSV